MRGALLRGLVLALIGTAAFQPTGAAAADPLATVAEQTRFQRTGRYDEIQRLCRAFVAAYPRDVQCIPFARTPEGRPMLALVATRTAARTPAQARALRVPVVFAQGGIHAGEPDGKDAGLIVLRELLADRVAPGALRKCVFVFVPVFNVDGHERFGPNQRPNQTGPQETGWRVTAQNLNLNRDYTKADAPEMQAMLRLLDDWDPILHVDLHTTDGAQFQYGIATQVEPHGDGDAALRALADDVFTRTVEQLQAAGAMPLPFNTYPDFRDEDPASGLAIVPSTPNFSHRYWPMRNRLAVLVETHSWKTHGERVRAAGAALAGFVEMTAGEGGRWLDVARAADERAAALGGSSVALKFAAGDSARTVDFAGYAYTRDPSPVSGGPVVRYDVTKPATWRLPFFDTPREEIAEVAPTGGYLVAAAHAQWVAQRLAQHGIVFRRLERQAAGVRSVEVFRAESAKLAPRSFEGRTLLTVTGSWQPQQRALPTGALYVPIAQPKARLVMHLLEPRAPASLLAWGFFNAHFEQKEYMEDYVAEEVAQQMLATRPDVAAVFRARLESDPAFARDPRARLRFFYERHPSWDDRLNVYPVMRVAAGVVE